MLVLCEVVLLVLVEVVLLVLGEVVLLVLGEVVLLVLCEDVKLVVGQRFSNSTRFRLLYNKTRLFKGAPGPGAASGSGTTAEADKAARESAANIRVDFMIAEMQSNCCIWAIAGHALT